jgi:hypothetical protein
MPGPEETARQQIDEALDAAGWFMQDVGTARVRASLTIPARSPSSPGNPEP